MFGAGDEKIGKIVGGSAEVGKRYKDQFLRELPALKQLIDRLTDRWRTTAKVKNTKGWDEFYNGYIKGVDGRPIMVDSPHKVLVYQLQSDEAIHMSVAYCMWHKWMHEKWKYKEMWGTVIWYHDEWEWECDPSIADESGQMACDAIRDAGIYLKIDCPHDGAFSVGANWMEVH